MFYKHPGDTLMLCKDENAYLKLLNELEIKEPAFLWPENKHAKHPSKSSAKDSFIQPKNCHIESSYLKKLN